MITDFTFEAEHNSATQTLTPINDDLLFVDEKIEGFRSKQRLLKTALVFVGSDYDYLKGILNGVNNCLEITLTIDYKGVEYWTGKIQLTKGEWDQDNCTVSITPDPDDAYTCLKENWEVKKNILDVSGSITLEPFTGTIETEECEDLGGLDPYPAFDDSCLILGPLDEWNVLKRTVRSTSVPYDTSPNSYDIVDIWGRETITTGGGTPPGDGWVLDSGTTYVRKLTLGERQTKLIENGSYEWVGFDYVWPVVGFGESNFDGTITIPNGRTLAAVLQDFADDCSLTIVSDFFDINAPGDNPSNDAYTAAASNLGKVVIFQKSDVKRPQATIKATIGELSFKELLTELKNIFNLDFKIDGTDLILEHISFFSSANGNNYESKAEIDGTNKFKFDNTRLPIRENFTWMESGADEDFDGSPIVYDNACSDRSYVEEYQNRLFVTNIQAIQSLPQQYADEGFVLAVAYESGGTYSAIVEDGAVSGDTKVNGHLARANLLETYWLWDRPQASGTMNGGSTNFTTTKKTKLQDPLEVVISPTEYKNIDSEENIKTGLGWGEVETMEYSVKDCTLKLNMRHD